MVILTALTSFTSLPDTTILVVVGFVLTSLALVLKKRLLASRIDPAATHEPTVES
jgi:hypothetical protein